MDKKVYHIQAHTRWNCQYHMVLMPPYYRNIIYGRLRKDRGKTIMDAA